MEESFKGKQLSIKAGIMISVEKILKMFVVCYNQRDVTGDLEML